MLENDQRVSNINRFAGNSLAIYLGLTNSYGNIVNVSAKTEMDSCMELSTEFFGDESEARKYCISAFAN